MRDRRSPTYGRCATSLAVGLAPLFLTLGVAALFGLNTLTINREFVHGPPALIISAVTPIILAVVIAAFQKLGYAIIAYWSDVDVEADA